MKSRPSIAVDSFNIICSTTTISHTTPTQISSGLANDVNLINVFNATSNAFKIMYGPAGSEVQAVLVSGGADKDYSTILNKGMRISLLAIGSDITAGTITLQMLR